jgi:hypothetical protein
MEILLRSSEIQSKRLNLTSRNNSGGLLAFQKVHDGGKKKLPVSLPLNQASD